MKLYFNQINLKTLSTLEDVDKNTVTICGQNGLLDLGKIIQYYLKNGNFLNLKKGNTASNQILTSICKKYLSNQFNSESGNESITEINEEIDSNRLNPIIENTNIRYDEIGEIDLPEAIVNEDDSKKENSILDKSSQVPENVSTTSEKGLEIPNYNLYELAQLEGLSVRTINTCKRYHLNNLVKILRYFYIGRKKFEHLRNCVSQSVDELEGLCKKYGNSTINPILNNSSINKIDALSVKQKALFNGLVRYRFSPLSVRSSDAIKTYIGSDIGIQGVKFILSNMPGGKISIQNLSINSKFEINDFINAEFKLLMQLFFC